MIQPHHKIQLSLLFLFLFLDLFLKSYLFSLNSHLASWLQLSPSSFTKYLLLTFSQLGSGGWVGGFTALYFFLEVNRIRAIGFLVYMTGLMFANGLLKNAYADDRPFWVGNGVQGWQC
jgi:hypothetical protein